MAMANSDPVPYEGASDRATVGRVTQLGPTTETRDYQTLLWKIRLPPPPSGPETGELIVKTAIILQRHTNLTQDLGFFAVYSSGINSRSGGLYRSFRTLRSNQTGLGASYTQLPERHSRSGTVDGIGGVARVSRIPEGDLGTRESGYFSS
ncbi:hypothetical protein C8J56DRAFT_889721 [Mycena floridula]|nr:hypothetical protein C8J56DRAFT_889721 [Mycena floridula]